VSDGYLHHLRAVGAPTRPDGDVRRMFKHDNGVSGWHTIRGLRSWHSRLDRARTDKRLEFQWRRAGMDCAPRKHGSNLDLREPPARRLRHVGHQRYCADDRRGGRRRRWDWIRWHSHRIGRGAHGVGWREHGIGWREHGMGRCEHRTSGRGCGVSRCKRWRWRRRSVELRFTDLRRYSVLREALLRWQHSPLNGQPGWRDVSCRYTSRLQQHRPVPEPGRLLSIRSLHAAATVLQRHSSRRLLAGGPDVPEGLCLTERA
jgi:hypothetical protein